MRGAEAGGWELWGKGNVEGARARGKGKAGFDETVLAVGHDKVGAWSERKLPKGYRAVQCTCARV